jgi:hypothetical protein
MNRIKFIVYSAIILLGGIYLSLNPLAEFICKGQLKRLLPGSTVTINSCKFDFSHGLRLSGLQISKKPAYNILVRSLQVRPDYESLLKNLPFDPTELVDYCELFVDSLEIGQAQLKSGYLKVDREEPDDGVIAVKELKIGKLEIKDFLGKAWLKDEYFFADSLSAKILGGLLKGSARIKFNAAVRYQAQLEFDTLDLDTFVKDFELEEKAEVNGKLSGSAKLQGQMQDVEILDGGFSSGKEGGTLTIKDRQFLENLARRSGLDPELVVESFRNYQYNTGMITASLQGNDLVFLSKLEGPTGKRSFEIIKHDLNPRRNK